LIQMMVPGHIFIIPQYMMLAKINALNTVFALIFPGLVSAYGTFLLRQQYMTLPKELEEAATLDGCNPWKTFTKVMMPVAKSSLASIGIFTALFAWKDLMWPLIANNDINKMSLAPGLSLLKGIAYTNKGVLMAGSVIATIPILLIYIVCQKQFIEGFAQTGIKG
jgi:multiple sugar transport system permease protein